MKFLVSYRARRGDADPAAAQRRAARLLNERPIPSNLRVRELLSRIGGGGGIAVVETDDPEALQHLAGLFAGCEFSVEPVTDVPFHGSAPEARPPATATPLPEMPASEPHEGAFAGDDIYDTED